MSIPTTYKKPRKLNFISFLLILAGIAAAYLAFQFLPTYYRKWMAKGVLSDSVNSIYPRRFISGAPEQEFMSQLQVKTIARLRSEVGIKDPGLTVHAQKNKGTATVSADYRERITHPFVGKTTVLHFRPWTQIDLTAGLDPK